jgi:hypothetical protein
MEKQRLRGRGIADPGGRVWGETAICDTPTVMRRHITGWLLSCPEARRPNHGQVVDPGEARAFPEFRSHVNQQGPGAEKLTSLSGP